MKKEIYAYFQWYIDKIKKYSNYLEIIFCLKYIYFTYIGIEKKVYKYI